MRSASSRIAREDSTRRLFCRWSEGSSMRPGVSRKQAWNSGPSSMPRMRCRVVCGLCDTIDSLNLSSEFSRADLPTLGRPASATNPALWGVAKGTSLAIAPPGRDRAPLEGDEGAAADGDGLEVADRRERLLVAGQLLEAYLLRGADEHLDGGRQVGGVGHAAHAVEVHRDRAEVPDAPVGPRGRELRRVEVEEIGRAHV